MGDILGAILVNCMGYLRGPLKWVQFWVWHWWIVWGNYVAHWNGWEFGCNIFESCEVFKWATEMGMLGPILVNQVGNLQSLPNVMRLWLFFGDHSDKRDTPSQNGRLAFPQVCVKNRTPYGFSLCQVQLDFGVSEYRSCRFDVRRAKETMRLQLMCCALSKLSSSQFMEDRMMVTE